MRKSLLLSGSLFIGSLLWASHALAQESSPTTEPLPYYQTFDDANSLKDFIVVDHNKDTWSWRFGHGHVGNLSSEHNGADDYLLTPLFHLQKGHHYIFRYITFAYSNSGWKETLETEYGTGDDPLQYAKVEEPFDITKDSTQALNRSNVVTPDSDGNYRFAFHAISQAPYFWLYIDNLLIKEVDGATPAAPADLTVTPDKLGELSASITFTAPGKDIEGNDLSGLDSVSIVRNDSVIADVAAQPGQQVSYTDNTIAKSDYYTYKVIAWNNNLQGQESSASTVYVGEDAPVAPRSVSIKDNGDGTGVVTWTAPDSLGRNYLYVNPKNFKYNVFKLNNTTRSWELVDSALTDTTYNVELPVTGDQDVVAYGVQTINKAGQSSIKDSRAVVGEAYSLPFHETFANAQLDNKFWLLDGTSGNDLWQLTTRQDCDLTGGSAAFQAHHRNVWSTYESGKINVKDAKNLKLLYYYNFNINHFNGNKLSVVVYKPDNTVDTLKTLTSDDAKKAGMINKWQIDEIDLNAYTGYDYIRVGFCAQEKSAYEAILLDGIRVRDVKSQDLEAVFYSAPSDVQTGDSTKFIILVNNLGNRQVLDYTVNLHVGNDVVSKESQKPLPSGEAEYSTFDYVFPVSAADTTEVWAEITNEGEEYPEDNKTATKKVLVVKPNVSVVTDLNASKENGEAGLTWTAPAKSFQKTEDFESYAPFSKGIQGPDSKTRYIGGWTTVDNDQTNTATSTDFDFEGEGTPLSYIVFNPSAIDKIKDDVNLQAHSGNQYLFAPNSTNYKGSDDWLISPSLSGNAQTIKFYASFGPLSANSYRQEFNVYYSTTGTDIADFTQLNTNGVIKESNKEGWDEFTYDLPEGAKYFAIQSVMRFGNGGLMIDDVTYEGGRLPIDHYNVYRDGKLIGNAPADASSFVDANAGDDDHTYNITIVYSDGVESAFSNKALYNDATGITSIKGNGNTKTNGRIYTIDGKEVKAMTRGLYIVNGKKIIRK